MSARLRDRRRRTSRTRPRPRGRRCRSRTGSACRRRSTGRSGRRRGAGGTGRSCPRPRRSPANMRIVHRRLTVAGRVDAAGERRLARASRRRAAGRSPASDHGPYSRSIVDVADRREAWASLGRASSAGSRRSASQARRRAAHSADRSVMAATLARASRPRSGDRDRRRQASDVRSRRVAVGSGVGAVGRLDSARADPAATAGASRSPDRRPGSGAPGWPARDVDQHERRDGAPADQPDEPVRASRSAASATSERVDGVLDPGVGQVVGDDDVDRVRRRRRPDDDRLERATRSWCRGGGPADPRSSAPTRPTISVARRLVRALGVERRPAIRPSGPSVRKTARTTRPLGPERPGAAGEPDLVDARATPARRGWPPCSCDPSRAVPAPRPRYAGGNEGLELRVGAGRRPSVVHGPVGIERGGAGPLQAASGEGDAGRRAARHGQARRDRGIAAG